MSKNNYTPIRKELKKLGNKDRFRFVGTVGRFGMKSNFGHPTETIMLTDVKIENTDNIVAEHLWFQLGKQFKDLNLEIGDKVVFNARVAKYTKGYMGYREDVWDKPIQTDYKLERPTKVGKICERE